MIYCNATSSWVAYIVGVMSMLFVILMTKTVYQICQNTLIHTVFGAFVSEQDKSPVSEMVQCCETVALACVCNDD